MKPVRLLAVVAIPCVLIGCAPRQDPGVPLPPKSGGRRNDR